MSVHGRTDGRTDGQKKESHNISPVHSVHLADIKTFAHSRQHALPQIVIVAMVMEHGGGLYIFCSSLICSNPVNSLAGAEGDSLRVAIEI